MHQLGALRAARVPHLGIPVVLLLISPVRYFVIVWPTLLTFMAWRLLNARSCGRIHCYVTGPFFLLLAALGSCMASACCR